MAAADYRLCDVCGQKTFYDANLNYEAEPSEWRAPWNDADRERGWKLDYLGDWAVICETCAATHTCVIVPKEPKA